MGAPTVPLMSPDYGLALVEVPHEHEHAGRGVKLLGVTNCPEARTLRSPEAGNRMAATDATVDIMAPFDVARPALKVELVLPRAVPANRDMHWTASRLNVNAPTPTG